MDIVLPFPLPPSPVADATRQKATKKHTCTSTHTREGRKEEGSSFHMRKKARSFFFEQREFCMKLCTRLSPWTSELLLKRSHKEIYCLNYRPMEKMGNQRFSTKNWSSQRYPCHFEVKLSL